MILKLCKQNDTNFLGILEPKTSTSSVTSSKGQQLAAVVAQPTVASVINYNLNKSGDPPKAPDPGMLRDTVWIVLIAMCIFTVLIVALVVLVIVFLQKDASRYGIEISLHFFC